LLQTKLCGKKWKQVRSPSPSPSSEKFFPFSAKKLYTSPSEVFWIIATKCITNPSVPLPKSVRHLGLVDCEVINVPTKESYFFNIHTLLPHLESLDLSNNPWLQNHSIQVRLVFCLNMFVSFYINHKTNFEISIAFLESLYLLRLCIKIQGMVS